MKELDELITYIENDLIGEHKDIEIIDESIKKYAELYHKKQLELYGVVDSLTSKEAIDYQIYAKLRERMRKKH